MKKSGVNCKGGGENVDARPFTQNYEGEIVGQNSTMRRQKQHQKHI
jgi:hypothetical protein